MNLKRRIVVILPLLGIVVLISCAAPWQRFKKIGRHLDHVAKSVEKYGTISVSSPLLFHATTQRML